MKIFLLLLTVIYLLPELYSFNLLIKSREEFYKTQQHRVDEVRRQMGNTYSKGMETAGRAMLLLFMFFYFFYIGMANIVIHLTWFLILSVILLIVFIIDYVRAADTMVDPDKMQKHVGDPGYLTYERVKIVLTFGYGLLVLILLIVG